MYKRVPIVARYVAVGCATIVYFSAVLIPLAVFGALLFFGPSVISDAFAWATLKNWMADNLHSSNLWAGAQPLFVQVALGILLVIALIWVAAILLLMLAMALGRVVDAWGELIYVAERKYDTAFATLRKERGGVTQP